KKATDRSIRANRKHSTHSSVSANANCAPPRWTSDLGCMRKSRPCSAIGWPATGGFGAAQKSERSSSLRRRPLNLRFGQRWCFFDARLPGYATASRIAPGYYERQTIPRAREGELFTVFSTDN